jgi:hypothetical protein
MNGECSGRVHGRVRKVAACSSSVEITVTIGVDGFRIPRYLVGKPVFLSKK